MPIMGKGFKVADRIIGSNKTNKIWKGVVVRVFEDGKKVKYHVQYNNGKKATVAK